MAEVRPNLGSAAFSKAQTTFATYPLPGGQREVGVTPAQEGVMAPSVSQWSVVFQYEILQHCE